MDNDNREKGLYTMLAILKTRLNKLKPGEEREIIQEEIENVQQRIVKLKNKEPIISDHALLRYMERVMKIDIDQIKNDIMNEKTIKSINFLNNCSIKNPNYTMVVVNSVVVTIK